MAITSGRISAAMYPSGLTSLTLQTTAIRTCWSSLRSCDRRLNSTPFADASVDNMNRSRRGPRHMSPEFQSFLDDGARLFRAPGRVNLIGEHTDYNDGFVMPAAIGFSTWVAVGLRDDRKLTIFSESFSDGIEV